MSGRTARRSAELAPAPRARFVLPREHRGVLGESERELALGLVRALLEAPTAPYAEDGPLEVVRVFAREHGLGIVEDRHANLVVTWKGVRRRAGTATTLAFSAHLDHPGFLYAGRRRGAHEAVFHGGVPARFLPGAQVRFFDFVTHAASGTARIDSVVKRGAEVLCRLVDVRGAPAKGALGMFDLTPGAVRGSRLHARVCDDLMGAAAILALLAWCVRERHPDPVVGIFTRAEETGFVGCLGLLRERMLARDIAVVGLECSPRRATARVGHGPVVRVGDRQSVFQPWITQRLHESAIALQAENPRFVFQRALMDGGSCESTAYNAYGVDAGALCLALGNYHNCGPGEQIASEFVDWDDHESLIALMRATTVRWCEGGSTKMMLRLNRIWRSEYKHLAASARRIRARSTRATEERTRRSP